MRPLVFRIRYFPSMMCEYSLLLNSSILLFMGVASVCVYCVSIVRRLVHININIISSSIQMKQFHSLLLPVCFSPFDLYTPIIFKLNDSLGESMDWMWLDPISFIPMAGTIHQM